MSDRKFNLVTVLSADNSDFNRDMKKSNGIVKQVGSEMKSVLTSIISPAGLAAASIGGLTAAIISYGHKQIDMTNQMNEAKSVFSKYNDKGEEITETTLRLVRAIADVGGAGTQETIHTINALSDSFKTGLNESTRLYNQLAVRHADNITELNKQLQEYSSILAGANISQEEFLNIVDRGLLAGIYDDKAVDFLKEVTISLAGMDDNTKKAIERLSNADTIFQQIKSGNYSDAFQSIAEGLKTSNLNSKEVYTTLQKIGKSLAEDIGTDNAITVLASSTSDLEKNLRLSVKQLDLLTEGLRQNVDVGLFSAEAKSMRKLKRQMNNTVKELYYSVANVDYAKIDEEKNKHIKEAITLYNKLADIRDVIGDDKFNDALSKSNEWFINNDQRLKSLVDTYNKKKALEDVEVKQQENKNEKIVEEFKSLDSINHLLSEQSRLQAEINKTSINDNDTLSGLINQLDDVNKMLDEAKLKLSKLRNEKLSSDIVSIESKSVSVTGGFNAKKAFESSFSTSTGLEESINYWSLLGDEIQNTENIVRSLDNAISGITDSFVGLFDSTESGFKDLVTSLLQGIGQIVNGLLAQAIAGMIAKESTKGVLGLVTASLGVGLLTALWKTKVPSFASGGILKGNSLQSGDQNLVLANAGEMFLNTREQSNLFRMLSTPGGTKQRGSNNLTGNLTVKGRDLVLAIGNNNVKSNSYK